MAMLNNHRVITSATRMSNMIQPIAPVWLFTAWPHGQVAAGITASRAMADGLQLGSNRRARIYGRL